MSCRLFPHMLLNWYIQGVLLGMYMYYHDKHSYGLCTGSTIYAYKEPLEQIHKYADPRPSP